ncbi:DUF4349 domain-containing protein [Streptomyces sp. NK08204]|uniref:DUF4349 domain-containing protein n=1 Tax=Streptomyces sp. NK08204 TaxID=2873260 RepID=UPI001CECB2A6|nr:DUF4349 domain-containing protein [Streptomyces sp. NK08204]
MRTPHRPHRPRSARPVPALAAVLLTVSLALAGCSASGSGGSSADKAAAGGVARGGAGSGAGFGPADGAKAAGATADDAKAVRKAPKLAPSAIIRTASLTIEVKHVPKALEQVRTSAETAGGYVGEETTSRDADGHEHTRVVLRVPTERYDGVLADLQGTGKLVERTAKAVDVTDQVVDVDSRIRSQRASVARIRALMNQADKLSDVVTLEGELSAREADLESLLARQASLKDRTSLATITLSLSETPVRKAAEDDSPGFVDALSGGWHVFVAMLRWLALALGAALPFAALATLLALVWRRVVRPRLPRRPHPASATTAPGPLPHARPVPDASTGRDGT